MPPYMEDADDYESTDFATIIGFNNVLESIELVVMDTNDLNNVEVRHCVEQGSVATTKQQQLRRRLSHTSVTVIDFENDDEDEDEDSIAVDAKKETKNSGNLESAMIDDCVTGQSSIIGVDDATSCCCCVDSLSSFSQTSNKGNTEKKKGILKKNKCPLTTNRAPTSSKSSSTTSSSSAPKRLPASHFPNRSLYYYAPKNDNDDDDDLEELALNDSNDKGTNTNHELVSKNQTSNATTIPIQRSVSFSSVDIKEFKITLGHHPNSTSGPPVMLDNIKPCLHKVMNIDEYERERSYVRKTSRKQLKLSRNDRNCILLNECGFTMEQINKAWSDAIKIRQQREESSYLDQRGCLLSSMEDFLTCYRL